MRDRERRKGRREIERTRERERGREQMQRVLPGGVEGARVGGTRLLVPSQRPPRHTAGDETRSPGIVCDRFVTALQLQLIYLDK